MAGIGTERNPFLFLALGTLSVAAQLIARMQQPSDNDSCVITGVAVRIQRKPLSETSLVIVDPFVPFVSYPLTRPERFVDVVPESNLVVGLEPEVMVIL